jgi:hypothetical protein
VQELFCYGAMTDLEFSLEKFNEKNFISFFCNSCFKCLVIYCIDNLPVIFFSIVFLKIKKVIINKKQNTKIVHSISCCGGKYGQQKINVKLKRKTHFLEDCSATSGPFQEM